MTLELGTLPHNTVTTILINHSHLESHQSACTKIDPDPYRSRADPNKGRAIYGYPGDSQCVIVLFLLISIVDHYPVRGSLP